MSSKPTFGQAMLEKYGWSEGKGLGREEDGISNAIKVTGNLSGTGFGFERGLEFTNQWWDHVYNKTAHNIVFEETEDGSLQVEKRELQENKKVIPFARSESCGYSSFVKAGTQKDVAVEKDMSLHLSCDELFKICGGKTAHKGARHGIKMTAKLERVRQQEEALMAKYSQELGKVNGEKRKKSKKKEVSISMNEDSFVHTDANSCNQIVELESCSRKHKKHKKQKKDRAEYEQDTNIDDSSISAAIDCNVEAMKYKQSKKERKLLAKGMNDEGAIRNETVVEEKIKRKRKHVGEERSLSSDGLAEEETCINGDTDILEKVPKKTKKKGNKDSNNCSEDVLCSVENTSYIDRSEDNKLTQSKKDRKILNKLGPDISNTGDNEVEIEHKKKKKSKRSKKDSDFKDTENDNANDICFTSSVLETEHKIELGNISEIKGPESSNTAENEVEIEHKKKKKKSKRSKSESDSKDTENDIADKIPLTGCDLDTECKSKKKRKKESELIKESNQFNTNGNETVLVNEEVEKEYVKKKKKKYKHEI